jgi:predicted amidophosphoribosyltransferase
MKPLRIAGAGSAPDRVLVVRPNTVDPGPNVRNRLAAIYQTNQELVHAPRDYGVDRQRQPLRWLSSMLRQRFSKSVEVQCYFDASRRSIVVSSNVSTVNEDIRRFLASAEFGRLLAEPAPPHVDNKDRLARHHAKLLRRMDPASDPHFGAASDAVLAAIAERRFQVPSRTYPVDLHAERRINNHMVSEFGSRVETEQLAGTMRPCSSCADELEAKPDVHRGPAWMSRASRRGFDHDENVDRQVQAGIGTSITRSRKNRLTFEHDTDSDSDA